MGKRKTKNTLVLLNFDDMNDPWKDECGNIWKPNGKAHLEFDLSVNKNIIRFTRKSNDFLRAAVDYNFGDKDFTIDGTCYLYNDCKNSPYSRIFELNMANPKGRMQFMRAGDVGTDNFKLRLQFYDTKEKNLFMVDTKNQFKQVWFHFAVVYRLSTQTFKVFIHGKKQLEKKFTKLDKFSFKSLTLGSSKSNPERRITGKIGYFRIENDVLFDEEFDPNQEIIEPVYGDIIRKVYNLHYDFNHTKRFIHYNTIVFNHGKNGLIRNIIYNYTKSDNIILRNSKNVKIYNNTVKMHIYQLFINTKRIIFGIINNYFNTKRNILIHLYIILKHYVTKRNILISLNNINIYNNIINDVNTLDNNNIKRNILANINKLKNNITFIVIKDIINDVNTLDNNIKRNILININKLKNNYIATKRNVLINTNSLKNNNTKRNILINIDLFKNNSNITKRNVFINVDILKNNKIATKRNVFINVDMFKNSKIATKRNILFNINIFKNNTINTIRNINKIFIYNSKIIRCIEKIFTYNAVTIRNINKIFIYNSKIIRCIEKIFTYNAVMIRNINKIFIYNSKIIRCIEKIFTYNAVMIRNINKIFIYNSKIIRCIKNIFTCNAVMIRNIEQNIWMEINDIYVNTLINNIIKNSTQRYVHSYKKPVVAFVVDTWASLIKNYKTQKQLLMEYSEK